MRLGSSLKIKKIQHPQIGRLPARHISVLTVCCVFAVTACSHQAYQAKPITPEAVAEEYQHKSTHDDGFKAYLSSLGYDTSQLPFELWDADKLSLCAFYFHPSLDVAKKQLTVAEADQSISTKKNNPSITVAPGRSDDRMNPWTFGLSLNLPFITNNKQAIKLENAQHLTEAARINIAETMWQLRQHVHSKFLEFQFQQLHIEKLKQEVQARQAMMRMVEKRVETGYSTQGELQLVTYSLLQAEQQLANMQQQTNLIHQQLAQNVGLPYHAFQALKIQSMQTLAQPMQASNALPENALISKELRAQAVLNRLDIRSALARYAAKEAQLKLEFANQIPDFSLSPSYNYEEGIQFWSLGINTLLKLAQNNDAMIAKASALRDLEAAQFEALQTQVIQTAEQAHANYLAAIKQEQHALKLLQQQSAQTATLKRSFDAGFIDRYELTQSQIQETKQAQIHLQLAQTVELAKLALEDALQSPLTGTSTVLNTITNELKR